MDCECILTCSMQPKLTANSEHALLLATCERTKRGSQRRKRCRYLQSEERSSNLLPLAGKIHGQRNGAKAGGGGQSTVCITSPMGSQIASNHSHLAPSRAQKRPMAQDLTQLQAFAVDPVSGKEEMADKRTRTPGTPDAARTHSEGLGQEDKPVLADHVQWSLDARRNVGRYRYGIETLVYSVRWRCEANKFQVADRRVRRPQSDHDRSMAPILRPASGGTHDRDLETVRPAVLHRPPADRAAAGRSER